MTNDHTYKVFFINYGIYVAILVILFGILLYPIKVGQKAWQKNLKANIEFVLDESEPNSWTVGNSVKIKNPFSMNSACYEVQTFYGPMPAVFTIDKDNNVEFVGYSSLHGRISEQITSNKTNKRINYWKSKIPSIIQ